CDGKGRTACSEAAAEKPSRAATKNATSATASSTSRSVGTTNTTVPRGIDCDAAATYNAFAGGVRPDTTVAGRSMPLLATAVWSKARRLREFDVVKPIQIIRWRGVGGFGAFGLNGRGSTARAADLRDEGGGGVTRLDRYPDDFPAARLDNVAPDD